MFYSRSLLSRKGPLGAIWVAAYCFKRLKRAQIFEANIPSSVDDILRKELDVMTYRVLAFLLLGLVKIYSKKVEYLFNDCHDVMIKINDFMVSEKSMKNLETRRTPYYSITLPDKFELDAFDLEILEDFSDDNVVPHEAITLKDGASTAVGIEHYSLAKYHCEEFVACHDICAADYALDEDFLLSHSMEIDSSLSMPPDLSNLEASLEKVGSNSFSQVQRAKLDKFCGIEKEPTEPIEPFTEDRTTDEEHIKVPTTAWLEKGLLGEATMTKINNEKPTEPIEPFAEDRTTDEELIKVSTVQSEIGVLGEATMEKLQDEEPTEPIEPFAEDCTIDEEHIKVPTTALSEIGMLGEATMENLQDDRFDGVEEEPLDHQSDREQIKFSNLALLENGMCQASDDNNNNIINLQASTERRLGLIFPHVCTDGEMFCVSEKEHPKQVERSGEEQQTEAEQTNEKCQLKTGEDPLSITPDAAPQSKFPDASGATTPEFVAVSTPAIKERARILRKRKCCFDEVVVFPNDVIRQRIQDSSDLVSKRRKAPRTALSAWRASQISNLLQGFLVPLLPYISLELRSLSCQERLKIPQTAKFVEPLEPDFPTAGISSGSVAIAPETPISKSSENMAFAPETPIDGSSKSMAIAPELPISGSSENMAIVPETPIDGSSKSTAFAPEPLISGSSENTAIATETPDRRSSENMAIAPNTPMATSSERMGVAVETPIVHSAASRTVETPESHKDAESIAVTPAHSYQTLKKELSSSKDDEFDLIFMTEETNSCEADDQEPYGLSTRTRMVARYLHTRFIDQKKRREDEAVELLPLLEGKTKKESARLFYEILALKNKGYLDVKQDEAYRDILIRRTPQWDQSCGTL